MMTKIPDGKRIPSKIKVMGDHNEFLSRITKSLYYSKFPVTDCLSLPVTEVAAELFTGVNHTLDKLDVEEASKISRNACVSPCSLVLALLYFEKLKDCNPEYLRVVAPSKLFLVSLMVASKFLNDDGEEDEVFNVEWAQSGNLSVLQINQLEKEFLNAIDWSIYVKNQDFWKRLEKLEKDVAYKEAQKRGWFSYTELSCLMNSGQLVALTYEFLNISSICLATYAIGIITLFGSTLIATHLPGLQLGSKLMQNSENITELNMNTILEATTFEENLVEQDTALMKVFAMDIAYSLMKYNKTCDKEEPMGSWTVWVNAVLNWLLEYSDVGVQTPSIMNHFYIKHYYILLSDNNFILNSTYMTLDEVIFR